MNHGTEIAKLAIGQIIYESMTTAMLDRMDKIPKIADPLAHVKSQVKASNYWGAFKLGVACGEIKIDWLDHGYLAGKCAYAWAKSENLR